MAPTAQFTIKQAATPDDYAVFVRLVQEFVDSYGDEDVGEFHELEAEQARPESAFDPRNSGAALLAIAPNGQAVGILGIKDVGQGRCELKRVWVQPKWRGHRVGRALCEAAIAAAKRLGYSTMLLDTLERLVPALKLYEALGFVRVPAERYTRPGTVDDIVFMELTL